MHIRNLPIGHKRLELSDSFAFSCHKGLSCFGSCCGNRDLQLTPYDVLRLKKCLEIHSDNFLAEYTVYQLDPATGFPAVSLKLKDNDRKECPFLTREGCSVYRERPTVCRLFPLARASGFKQDSLERDEFFYMLPPGPCLGGGEEKTQSIKEWIRDQEVEFCRTINDKMLYLLFHPGRDRSRALSERQLQKIIVACYNLDIFREFVFSTNFLDAFSIDDPTRTRISEDDLELLMLGFGYLRTTLFDSSYSF